MKILINLFLIIAALVISSCGDPAVDISTAEFENKIVVEGYLYPSEKIEGIKIMKNFKLNSNINPLELLLTPSKNNVKASINNIELDFDFSTGTYFTDNLVPTFNKSYTLIIEAEIDGKTYFAESTTITPKKGFNILEKNLGVIKYREEDPIFNFTPSENIGFYTFSIRPLDASLDNFIYDNPYFPNLSEDDVKESFNRFLYQRDIMINVNYLVTEPIEYKVRALDTWFYSSYQVIVYAGDENFKDYSLTVDNVQEPDGNFIEPKFHFKGDGIGIFGSAIRDTLTFKLEK